MSQHTPSVKTGLDILVSEQFSRLQNLRVALLGHPASIDANLEHLLTLCLKHQINVVKLFGPEHGFLGNTQDMEFVGDESKYSIPTISLYGPTHESLFIKPEQLADVDVLVCDLQDVGSRYYTFAYTVAFAMKSCAQAGIRCMVLDRPNPINGTHIEGNKVLPAFRSFVGEYPIANRHGLTIAELVKLFRDLDPHLCEPEIIHMQGWRREQYFEDTGLPWVFPSPNMPTPTTALMYPGACLWEGTNLSEGRGTTKPFELVGAPYIHDVEKFAALIEQCELPGVKLRTCYFTPQFQKHAKQLCGGVQLHITDRHNFLSLKTGVAVLWAARQFEGFDWRRSAYEFVSDRLAIDLLFGDDKPRLQLEKNASVDDIMHDLTKTETSQIAVSCFYYSLA